MDIKSFLAFKTLKKEKINLAAKCDYADPEKIKYCPPAIPMKKGGNLNLPGKDEMVVIPAKCLEDVDGDDPDW